MHPLKTAGASYFQMRKLAATCFQINNLASVLIQAVFLLCLSGTLTACFDSHSVTVHKARMLVTKYEIRGDGQANVDSGYPRDGLSHWSFRFVPQITLEKVKSQTDATGCAATFKVKNIAVNLSLPFDVFMRKGASQKSIDHQDGYVKICKRYYRDASAVARKDAIHFVGKEIEGRGQNEAEAKQNAVNTVSLQMLDFYREKIVIPSDKATSAYRALTKNGDGDMPVQDAIDRAISQAN